MNTKNPIPPLTPEELATERLADSVESAIGVLQQRLANFAGDNEDKKWSLSDLVKLLQLRNQLAGERPRIIRAYWVDDPNDPANNHDNIDNGIDDNDDNQPEPDTRTVTSIDNPRLYPKPRK